MSALRLFLQRDFTDHRRVVCAPVCFDDVHGLFTGSPEVDASWFVDKVLDLRKAVFVQEQGVALEDELDDFDPWAFHLAFLTPDGLRAYATLRILLGDGYAKIGRVAVDGSQRGTGVGRQMMDWAHLLIEQLAITQSVLDAQVVVVPFYEKLGYISEGPIFLDAGIEHQKMRRCKH
jgi:predicted GNAT family N-acyltransferase